MTRRQSEAAKRRWAETDPAVRQAHTRKGFQVASRKRRAASDLMAAAIAAIEQAGGQCFWTRPDEPIYVNANLDGESGGS